ncbi:MAG: DNA cytosine methyltransferase [Thalassotalea sp.]|nr:DNA cytosine methyltransferase [Thalassotalea sp.]
MFSDSSHAVVDLFCGAGGLTHGLKKAGLNVVAGFDIEEKCSYAYETNNKPARFVAEDVSNLTKSDVDELYGNSKFRVLAGCAPCQPFSTYTQAKDKENCTKWPLLYEFSRLIRETAPHVVTMENVPDVVKHKVYDDFVEQLKQIGYKVWANKVKCQSYGVPQQRVRHVLLASKLGDIKLIEPTEKSPRTVEDTIADLMPIQDGQVDVNDPLHKASKLSEINKQRILHSVPGGTWRDWPEELLATCHRKASGKGYSSVYGRMVWDEPSPTITTLCYGFGNGRFGHPEQDRGLSLREAALLQSFPKDYEFVNPSEVPSMKHVGRMIGNAVPVKLGEAIGQSIQEHLLNYERS